MTVNNLSPGDPLQIGRYRVLGQLGRGGMGTVHLGESPEGQRVAIKVINPEYSQHEQFRMRFRREAEAAQRVRRFCTAAVLEAALDGDQLYVVTEYVPGPNLEEAVRSQGPLRGSSLDALAVGVATALTAIHGAGVVHRDLKPSNVLLSPVGPRVIDFGIARALDTLSGITGTGEIIGTPRYMAPEVLRGEPVSPACDVFSWGCLVAFAASGHAPFGGEALPAVLYQVLNTEPSLEGMEPSLRELVAYAIAKDPRNRPTSQQVLDHLVGRAAAPEQAASSVQTAWQQSPPATTATAQWQAGPTERHTGPGTITAPAAGQPARRKKLIAGAAVAAVVATAGGVGLYLALSAGGPPSDLRLVYQDDFTQSGNGWSGGTYEGDSRYGYAPEGYYAMDVDGSNSVLREEAPVPFVTAPPATPDPSASPTPVIPGRLLLGVDIKIRSSTGGTGEYGLFCRGDDGTRATRYEFLLDTAGNARIRKSVNSAGGDLAKATPVTLEKGESVHLQAECSGSSQGVQLAMWVNGDRVQSILDSSPLPPGNVGMVARVGENSKSSLKTSFDNFTMHGAVQGSSSSKSQ
ncbi:serine/threonine-protein kinase [Streptosporangium sp. NPDC000396]|uniref:serine/threonine-protein kinase n=1 Tax=Streptosporangium sp. NPDC000396 TaxID=3366185 RepID=UPI0036C5567B